MGRKNDELRKSRKGEGLKRTEKSRKGDEVRRRCQKNRKGDEVEVSRKRRT